MTNNNCYDLSPEEQGFEPMPDRVETLVDDSWQLLDGRVVIVRVEADYFPSTRYPNGHVDPPTVTGITPLVTDLDGETVARDTMLPADRLRIYEACTKRAHEYCGNLEAGGVS